MGDLRLKSTDQDGDGHGNGTLPLVQSVRRVLHILEAFSVERPVHSLASLSQSVHLPKSTVRRLLATLEEEGFVARSDAAGSYRLTVKMVRLAGSVFECLTLRKVALPAMQRVRDKVEDTAFLNMLDGDLAVVVEKADGLYPVRNVVEVGSRKPLYSGAGSKVLLAFSSDSARLDRVIQAGLEPFTPYTIKEPHELRLELERIRTRGYCVAAEEHILGSTAVAAPIYDHTGEVVASLSVAGISPRFGSDRLAWVLEVLLQGAARVSDALGYDGRHAAGGR